MHFPAFIFLASPVVCALYFVRFLWPNTTPSDRSYLDDVYFYQGVNTLYESSGVSSFLDDVYFYEDVDTLYESFEVSSFDCFIIPNAKPADSSKQNGYESFRVSCFEGEYVNERDLDSVASWSNEKHMATEEIPSSMPSTLYVKRDGTSMVA